MAATIELRDFRPGDAPAVHRWFNDARVTADLVGSRDAFTEDDARGWVERAMDASRDRKWAIVLDGGDEPVGFVALFGLEREPARSWRCSSATRRHGARGVAREAERQACMRAFASTAPTASTPRSRPRTGPRRRSSPAWASGARA